MRVFVEAYGHDRGQILGNLDGQRSWAGKNFRRTRWYKQLAKSETLKVCFWQIINESGKILEIVFPIHSTPGRKHRP